MGKIVKVMFASGIAVILIGYLASAAYMDLTLRKMTDAIQAEKMQYALRREQLYIQNAKLDTAKTVLSAQLQYELESIRQVELRNRFMSQQPAQTASAAAENKTSLQDALNAQKAKLEAQLKAQADAAKVAEQKRLTTIKQRVSSSSSGGGGGGRTTRAS